MVVQANMNAPPPRSDKPRSKSRSKSKKKEEVLASKAEIDDIKEM